jgi:hypothetical protein
VSDLYRLVYASKNHLQGSDAEIAEAVSQILDASQRNNARVGVTGALMFNAGAFAQVLEGSQQGVESTFERIQCDPRHGDVTVLQCGPAESRSFANWSMAFVGQSDAGRARWDGIAATSGFDLSRLDGDAVFAMLHGLVLDEEGLPAVASTPQEPHKAADKLARGLDAERVRAELPLPGQALHTPHDAAPMPTAELPPARPLTTDTSAHTSKPDAALAILRAALAQERQLTTELRNELDEVRISLAVQGEQFDALRQERDLWAKRAELLATLVCDEAREVAESSNPATIETSKAQGQSPLSASIRIVA